MGMLLVLSVALACSTKTGFTEEPKYGMGVRFTRRGLEKFCQKGYALIPDFLSQMSAFSLPEIAVGSLKLVLSNVRPRTVRVSTMKVYLQDNNFVKMEARDGLMQLSMRLKATIIGITGTVDCIFTLKDFGADVSLRLGDDPTCPYHFGLFNISNVMYSSGLDIDAIGLDTGGSVLANALQGMRSTLETLLKDNILQFLFDAIFNSIKQSMLNKPPIAQIGDYLTDQRYIDGINVIDKKVVANQGGHSMIINTADWSARASYSSEITLPLPKAVYSDRDYELYFDRESVNSYLYAWHVAYDKFRADGLTVPYSAVRAQNIPGLAEALVKANMLTDVSDSGDDITLTLSVHPSKDAAPHIPWIGAAALPVNITGALTVTASKASASISTTLINSESGMLFSSLLKLKKYIYGATVNEIRAYLKLINLDSITITKENNESMRNSTPLLKYLILNEYLPFVNSILINPGICLLNWNAADLDTIISVHLCNEDRVLFVADIEKNQYFA